MKSVLRRILSLVSPPAWRAWQGRRAGAAFDRRFGTDTQASVGVDALDIPPGLAAHAVHYEASSLPKLRRALRHLGVRPSGYSFVDVGSGKGMVVLEAARRPFEQVTGIEVSSRLHEVAIENLERFSKHVRLRAPVEFLNVDALAFSYPARRQVIYLYNPFDEPVLRALVSRLEERLTEGVEDVLLAYVNPVHRRTLEHEFNINTIFSHSTLVIYRLLPR